MGQIGLFKFISFGQDKKRICSLHCIVHSIGICQLLAELLFFYIIHSFGVVCGDAVIHFEKANSAIDGIYQLVNQWFCQNGLTDYKYVNREQDLGIPELRKAKQGYHPHHMVSKYKITK